VPTDAKQPGDYIFKLVAVVKQEQGTTEITRSTEPIKIKPKPLKILSFKINGQEAANKPKHVYLLNEQGDTVEVVLSWIVEGGADIQVELSPSPGRVAARGTLNYTLSPPSTETITLKVSNKSGNQQSQSAVIQTITPQASTQLPALPPPPSSRESVMPAPSNQNQLSPVELPPQPN